MPSKKGEVYLGPLVAGAGLWAPDREPPIARRFSLFTNDSTGLLQQGESLPIHEMGRTHPWLVQIEPESHIEHLVRILKNNLIEAPSRILGLSFKDATTLRELGATDYSVDHQPLISGTDVPFIPDDFARFPFYRNSDDTSTVLISRHILEHATSPRGFLANCRKFVGKSGYLLLEVPDAEPAIENFDFSEIWDEHMAYFTNQSLQLTLESAGFRVLELKKIQSDGEDLLCVLAQPSDHLVRPKAVNISSQVEKTDHFLGAISRAPDILSERFSNLDIRSVTVLGANHRSSNLIDIFLPEGVRVNVIDDDPRKHGLTISKQRVPVVSRHLAKKMEAQPGLIVVALNNFKGAKLLNPLSDFFGGKPLTLPIAHFYREMSCDL